MFSFGIKRESDNKINVQPASVSVDNQKPDDGEKNFNAELGQGREEKIFSIKEVLANGCSDCEFNPNQFWEFTVSPDFSRYAYAYWTGPYEDDKAYIVLDGKKQKEYDEVYELRFDSTGKHFTYHAYDEKKDRTYLVYDGREILIHSGFEWYSYSNDNATEAFSQDGKRFAYAALEKEGSRAMLSIILDGKEINKVEGEEIKMRFEGDILQYAVSDKEKTPEDDRYYENENLLKSIDYMDYSYAFKEFRGKRNEEEGPKDCATYIHIESGRRVCASSLGFVFLDGVELENHEREGRALGFSDFTLDNESKNIAYKIVLPPMWYDEWVSLNGNNSSQVFNDIQNLHFSRDGKFLVYVGRKGANVYRVTHEILPKQR